ncbi:hypothetical protein B0H17DRAFT_1147819 [Mycena rosella]|uniref:DUF6534 domain-containing protein n=1 Tax=Mycena rosella TaxID=1033263 RepID=A0AAD7CHN9_MYCRO|nr:hypothetical protein B0H17DRAFT_1147819 [Mycena rosella]
MILLQITVETGLLCVLFALLDLSLFIRYGGNNYHLAVCIWFSKVYSNSIMVILNSRAYIGHAPHLASPMTELAFHSHGMTVQVSIEASSTTTRDSDSIPQSAEDKDEVHVAVLVLIGRSQG